MSDDLIERLLSWKHTPGGVPEQRKLIADMREAADALAAKDTAISEALERNQKLGLSLNDAHAAFHRAEARATAADAQLETERHALGHEIRIKSEAIADYRREKAAREAAEAQLERAKKALGAASKYIKRGYVTAEGGAILDQIAHALSQDEPADLGVGG